MRKRHPLTQKSSLNSKELEAMNNDQNNVNFFEFWTWQYTKRNPRILSASYKIKEYAEKLYANGLLKEPELIKNDGRLIISSQIRYSTQDFEYTRDPTDEENKIIIEIDLLSTRLKCGEFNIDDIISPSISSTQIIHSIITKSDIYALTPESQKTYSSDFVRCFGRVEADDETLQTPYLVDKGIGLYSFYIDIHAPDEVLVSGLLSEVMYYRSIDAEDSQDSGESPEASRQHSEDYTQAYKRLALSERSAAYSFQTGVGFKAHRAESRAVGIWLWDYAQKLGGIEKRGVKPAAIRAMKSQFLAELKLLGYAESDDRVFWGLAQNTAACIEECKVLPFS